MSIRGCKWLVLGILVGLAVILVALVASTDFGSSAVRPPVTSQVGSVGLALKDKISLLQRHLDSIPEGTRVRELVVQDGQYAVRLRDNPGSFQPPTMPLPPAIAVNKIAASLCSQPRAHYWPACYEDSHYKEGDKIPQFCVAQLQDRLQRTPLEETTLRQFIDVQHFVLFLGHPRSGSSIVGAILDAHPRALICSSEYLVLQRLVTQEGFHSNRDRLFSAMLEFQKRTGNRCRSGAAAKKGYNTCADGMGQYGDQLRIVGDKAAGQTVGLYQANRTAFGEVLQKLREVTRVGMKFIEVLRNPYDNIATKVIYDEGKAELRKKLLGGEDESGEILRPNATAMNCTIRSHFIEELAVMEMVQQYGLDLHRLHLSDLIARPSEEVQKLCSFLDLHCSEDYLRMSAEALFKESSKSRYKVEWTQEQISTVQLLTQQFTYLHRYSFDSD